MTTTPHLPDLRIVPANALLLHEECDPARVERLAGRLSADGILRNPPAVAPLDDRTSVVLDGANRVTAMHRVGLPHQLVQVVDYDDPAVRLETWAHLLQDDGALVAGGGFDGRVQALAGIVARYKGRVPICRVRPADLGILAGAYGRAAALVLFPRFTKRDIRARLRDHRVRHYPEATVLYDE
ncbi:MAG: hypothetical protein QME77_06965 [bacterium]|nr:hypothetical protein [bacterium]